MQVKLIVPAIRRAGSVRDRRLWCELPTPISCGLSGSFVGDVMARLLDLEALFSGRYFDREIIILCTNRSISTGRSIVSGTPPTSGSAQSRPDARVQAFQDRGDHPSGDRIAPTNSQGAVQPRLTMSLGATCACCLGGGSDSPIRLQHRRLRQHDCWVVMLFAPKPPYLSQLTLDASGGGKGSGHQTARHMPVGLPAAQSD